MTQKYIRYPFASTGDVDTVPDTTQPDNSVSYQEGYSADYSRDLATDPAALPIEREKFNQLMNDVTTDIQQYQQHGTPEFITSADNGGVAYSYSKGDRVRYDDGSGYLLYESLINSNTDLPTVTASWAVINASGTTVEAYPVGSLFLSTVSTNPATLLGYGTWVAYGEGRVLVGAGTHTDDRGQSKTFTAGSTEGEYKHALTSAENGPHNHLGGIGDEGTNGFIYGGTTSGVPGSATQNMSKDASVPTYQGYTSTSGSGTAHNNIQPCIACYMWHRTA